MIKVNLYRKSNNELLGFNVSGHAEFDESGKDIVCAAVSMLTYNTIDTFTDILSLDDFINFEIKENEIEFIIEKKLKEEDKKYAQLILKKFELGIKSLLNEYGDFIVLNYTEV